MFNLKTKFAALKEKVKNKDFIKTWLRRRSYKRAVQSAEKLRSMYGKKYLVLFWKGQFRAIPKQTLKAMWQCGHFQKGINLAAIEKMAVYSTN